MGACVVAQLCPALWDRLDCSLTRLLCPWNFPGKNTGVGCHFLLQGVFLTQGLNSHLLHCRQILYSLNNWGSPILFDMYIYISLWICWQINHHHHYRFYFCSAWNFLFFTLPARWTPICFKRCISNVISSFKPVTIPEKICSLVCANMYILYLSLTALVTYLHYFFVDISLSLTIPWISVPSTLPVTLVDAQEMSDEWLAVQK